MKRMILLLDIIVTLTISLLIFCICFYRSLDNDPSWVETAVGSLINGKWSN